MRSLDGPVSPGASLAGRQPSLGGQELGYVAAGRAAVAAEVERLLRLLAAD